ncbi:unnamed protein product [Rotaria sp. Silwood2]|nr:unnamed protein product [Rotaria sp. Silwood2]CAF3140249.1 unnamed protein product [Rotaria sp. Silwood2]CAF3286841.1 unnamed protein product [Rotaria sp. Silwood2]CAF3902619.1 unnamed protein product [Rotaria sp. Silwood2]CAF4109774.1 unnamed protein product [Rotaria sp. Silwood2]
MHTIFRTDDIRKLDNNRPLYQVDLKLTSDDDQQLRRLADRIQDEAAGGTGWTRSGQTSSESDKAHIYDQLGWLKDDQGQYKEAVSFYEQSLEIKQKTLLEDHSDLAASYNNMGDYSKALPFLEKTLTIQQKALSPSHPAVKPTMDNIDYVKKKL